MKTTKVVCDFCDKDIDDDYYSVRFFHNSEDGREVLFKEMDSCEACALGATGIAKEMTS